MPKYQPRLRFSQRLTQALEREQELKQAGRRLAVRSPEQEPSAGDACEKLDFVSPLLASGVAEEAAVREAGSLLADYSDPAHPEKRRAVLDTLCGRAARLGIGTPDFSCLLSGNAGSSAVRGLSRSEADVLGLLRAVSARKTLDLLLDENPEYAQAYFEKGPLPEFAYETVRAALADAPLVSAGTDLCAPFRGEAPQRADRTPEAGAGGAEPVDAAGAASLEYLAGLCAAYDAAADGRRPPPVRLTLSDPAEREDDEAVALQERADAFDRIFSATLAQAKVMDADPLSLLFIDGTPLSGTDRPQDEVKAEALRALLSGCHTLDTVIPAYDPEHRLAPTALSVEPDLHGGDGEFREAHSGRLRRIVSPLWKIETPADRLERFQADDRAGAREQRHVRLETELRPRLCAGEILCKKRGALRRVLRQWERSFARDAGPQVRQDGCGGQIEERRAGILRACADVCPDRCAGEKAVEAANRIAPEHLELCVDDPFALLHAVRNAGSIFLGRHAPEALGDYFAGPNHTLPTSGTARFSSPLSVDDFVKKSSFLYYTQEALSAVSPRIQDFARREGLEAHARSVEVRGQRKEGGGAQ